METRACGVPVAAQPSDEPNMGLASRGVADDPAEAVARVADSRRDRMLRIHRRRLRWEDLEDCYSQATLELVARSRRAPFASLDHLLNALEQKFLSRIDDRRRAIGGRSSIETAMARAVQVDAPEHGAGEIEDRRATIEQQVIARTELRRLREVIADLSRDQRLVLASQVCVDMGASEFCSRYGWSVEKYRKVAQRARGKLRVLVEEYERGERCLRLEADILAMSAGLAEGEHLTRARAHVSNCQACARMASDVGHTARSVAAVLPIPAAFAGAASLKLGAIWSGLRRVLATARHPLTETSYGGMGAAGGSAAGIGALKVGMAVVCVAGAAGSYAVCAHLGVIPSLGLTPHTHRALVIAPRRSEARAVERHKRRRVAAVHARVSVPTFQTPVATVGSAASATKTKPRQLTAIEQVRREFGTARLPRAAAAAVTAAPAITSTAGPAATTPTPASRQTQAEFGFER